MAGGIFHCRFNQNASCALVESTAGKIVGKLQIEMVDALGVGFCLDGGGFDHGDIQARGLDRELRVIDGFSEEIVGANGASDMIAGAVAVSDLLILAGKID